MNKRLSIFLALVLIISVFTPNVTSAKENDFYLKSAKYLNEQGILKGTSSGDLLLKESLNRQDMVIMLSRLYKEEEKAKAYPVNNNFKDITNNYYKPFISWGTDKGLIKGIKPGIFGFNQKVNIQAYQAVLLRSLGYEKETLGDNWRNVPVLASKLGIMNNIDAKPNDLARRDRVAGMTLNALNTQIKGKDLTLAEDLKLKLPVNFEVDHKYKINGNALIIEGKVKGTEKIAIHLVNKDNPRIKIDKEFPLGKQGNFEITFSDLISGKYEYYFSNETGKVKGSYLEIKEKPFELESISSPNLKEIHLNFNNPINRDFALGRENCITDAGKISSIRFENKDKKVVLSLAKNNLMNNGKEYNLYIPKIETKGGQILKDLEAKFTSEDKEAPKVVDIKPLGTSRIKLILSEPVKQPSVFDFSIDDKSFNGRIQNYENTITLIMPNGDSLDEGNHKLKVNNLLDYFGNKSDDLEASFNIIKDKTALKIVEYNANIDEVALEFNKDIDVDKLKNTDLYWMIGKKKIYPSHIKSYNQRLELYFNGENVLPAYETPLYLNNIVDFYGNKLDDEVIRITPSQNKDKPKLVSVNVFEGNQIIEVLYNKRVEGQNPSSYIIKDSNLNFIPITKIEPNGRSYKIYLSEPLTVGNNSLTIVNIKDTLDENNILTEYTKLIPLEDLKKPNLSNYFNINREILLHFDMDMNLESLTNPLNYLVKFNDKWRYLPDNTKFEVIGDNKTIKLILPKTIANQEVTVGLGGNITELQMLGLKSKNDSLLEPKIISFDNKAQGETRVEKAVLEKNGIIKLRFDQPIVNASKKDFLISKDIQVVDAYANSTNEVILTLNNSGITGFKDDEKLQIIKNNNIETLMGSCAQSQSIEIEDKVAPIIISDEEVEIKNNIIELHFSEDLDEEIAIAFKRDLSVERISGKNLGQVDFTTDAKNNILKIKLHSGYLNDKYKLSLNNNPIIIMDKHGNIAKPDNRIFYSK